MGPHCNSVFCDGTEVKFKISFEGRMMREDSRPEWNVLQGDLISALLRQVPGNAIVTRLQCRDQNEKMPKPWTAEDQTQLWTHHSAGPYQSPPLGKGRSHSCLPTRPRKYSSILVWWRWGPARYHRDWHRWDYSSILSFLPWVDLHLRLKRVEKVRRGPPGPIRSVSQHSRRHNSKKVGVSASFHLHKMALLLSVVVDSSTTR